MKRDLLSVIIPVYNAERYLECCIESVLSQTYSNLEVILVDDGSKDSSGNICNKYASNDRRVKVIHQRNHGVLKARCEGIKKATGVYITFIDADDWIESDMYEKMFEKGQGFDLISSGVIFEYPNVKKGIHRYDKFPEGGYYSDEDMNFVWKNAIYIENTEERSFVIGSVWNKIFKRALVEKVCDFQWEELKFGEDLVFLYKYLLMCRNMYILHDAYYHYRIVEGSASHSANKFFLCNINWLYLELEKEFVKHPYNDCLRMQLEMLVREFLNKGLNYYMGFGDVTRKIIYNIPYKNQLDKKRIVLYGAGRVGKDYYMQLKKMDCEIVLWVDANYKNCDTEMKICDVTDIKDIDYDYIVVAVKRKEIADSMREQLMCLGVSGEKVLWRGPVI